MIEAEQLTTVASAEAAGDPDVPALELEAGGVAFCSPQATIKRAANTANAADGLISD